MQRTLRLSALVLVAVLAGCAGDQDGFLSGNQWDIDKVSALPIVDDPYLAGLQEGYVKYAQLEQRDFDWTAVTEALQRARAAAMGQGTAPLDPAEYTLADDPAEGIDAGYKRLKGYLASEGAMLRAARQVGDAQVAFDCWVLEAREGLVPESQAKELEDCRGQFELLMQLIFDLAALPANMAVVLPEDGEIGGIEVSQGGKALTLDRPFAAAGTGDKLGALPVAEGEIRDAFAGALAAQPKPPVEFNLTFDFNQTTIGDQAFEAILAAADEARSRPAAEVLITGYADALGSPADNLAVSRARAEAVRKAVFYELRDAEKITISAEAKGERDLAVDAAGQEQANRRVVILVR